MAAGNDAQTTQFGSLDKQFEAGIRAFQGHIWMIDDALTLTTSNGNSTDITLRHACNRLQEEMQNSHSHGFCVLLLSDYEVSGSGYSITDVYNRFQDLTSELQAANILAPDITPTTTLADVRGKIILKLQLNGSSIPYEESLISVTTNTNRALTALQMFLS